MDLVICALDFIQCSTEKWCLPEAETWLWETSWTIVSAFVTDFEDREKQRWEKRLWNVFLWRRATHCFGLFRQTQSSLCLSESLPRWAFDPSTTSNHVWQMGSSQRQPYYWSFTEVGKWKKSYFLQVPWLQHYIVTYQKNLCSRENLQRTRKWNNLQPVTKYKSVGCQAFSSSINGGNWK